MNVPAPRFPAEWPKWVDAKCPRCKEQVPKMHMHYCDPAYGAGRYAVSEPVEFPKDKENV